MKRVLDREPMKAPSRLSHVTLRVQDLERSIAWYGEVVGMEVVEAIGPIAFLTFDFEHHRMALIQTSVSSNNEPGAPGLDHIAFTIDSLGQLLSTYRRLADLGHKPYLPINHGVTTSLYYRDPDGNGVEFNVENFETEKELKGWMHSDVFKANPVGVPFEPEELIARYEAGEAIEDLLRLPTTVE
jgi:catechol-2,3-dioxygenase